MMTPKRVGARIIDGAELANHAKATLRSLALSLLLGLPHQALARDPYGVNAPASAHSTAAKGASRADEIQSCLPHELQTWGDGKDSPTPHRQFFFEYRHSSQTYFTQEEVTERINKALGIWQQCGLSLALAATSQQPSPSNAHRVAVNWDSKAAAIGIAVADLGRGRLSLNPKVFDLLLQRRDRTVALETLQMTLSHEIGHFFGMRAHSKRCIDVMSYYTDTQGNRCIIRNQAEFGKVLEYRSSLPTACDIERCKRLNQ